MVLSVIREKEKKVCIAQFSLVVGETMYPQISLLPLTGGQTPPDGARFSSRPKIPGPAGGGVDRGQSDVSSNNSMLLGG